MLPQTVLAQDGREHTLIACETGAVKSFGYNTSCEIGVGNNDEDSYTTPYSINSGYINGAVAVAIGDAHSLVLLDDGTVKAWGINTSGCSGRPYPTYPTVCEPFTIELPGCAVAIAAGSNFSLALLADGTIYSWGVNTQGQLGNGITTSSHMPDTVIGITNAIAISAGASHAMALLEDGTVRVWGRGDSGQMGDGSNGLTNSTPDTITTPMGMSDIVAIDAGGSHCVVLTEDNNVYSWGANSNGQLGVGSSNSTENEPMLSSVFSSGTEIDIAAGENFTFALRSDGTTRVAGGNERRQLGLSSPTSSPWPNTPITGPTINNAIDIVAPPTARHAWAITSTGSVYTWGDNNYGACGFVSAYPRVDTPTAISVDCAAIPSEANHPQPCCVSVLEVERIVIGSNHDTVTFTTNQTYSGLDMAIFGTVILDSGIHYFNHCDVVMGKDAKIIVNYPAQIRIYNGSHLYACGDMWDGIEANNRAQVRVYGNSTIEDAEIAIDVEDGAYYYIYQANFNRNYKHIRITDPVGTPYYAVQRIRQSKFLCQNSISDTTYANLLPPRQNDYTWVQIEANDVRGLLVGSSGNRNTFNHAVFGVVASGVKDVEVLYNDFDDVGWYATWAAYAPNVSGTQIDISNNTYQKSLYPIYCYDNDVQARTHITNNTIDFEGMGSPPPTGMTGITYEEITPASGGNLNFVDISENTILKAPTGIRLANLLGDNNNQKASIYVYDNTITHQQSSSESGAGIRLENVVQSSVVDNDISHPTGATNYWETAIRSTSGSNGNGFYCNYIHHIGNGILFDGYQTTNTTVANNDFEVNHRAFMLNWGDIGPQPNGTGIPHDNEWIDTSYWDINNYKYTTQVLGTHTHTTSFGVREAAPSVYYPDHNHRYDPTGQFITVSVIGSSWLYNCVVNGLHANFKADGSEEVTEQPDFLPIIEPVAAQSEREANQQWVAKYGLYSHLTRNSSLAAENAVLSDFQTENNHGNIGKLQRAVAAFSQSPEQEAANELGTIQPSNSMEQTLVDVLSLLYANAAELATLSDNQIEQLREIALRCPLDDGFGVFIARSALLKVDTLPRNYYNECELLQPTEEQRNKSGISESEHEFSLYPNPSSGSWTINLALKDEEIATVDVFDIIGQRVFTGQINRTGPTDFESYGMSNGVYIVRVLVNGQLRFSRKLTILR